jgi:hypothetical protein
MDAMDINQYKKKSLLHTTASGQQTRSTNGQQHFHGSTAIPFRSFTRAVHIVYFLQQQQQQQRGVSISTFHPRPISFRYNLLIDDTKKRNSAHSPSKLLEVDDTIHCEYFSS